MTRSKGARTAGQLEALYRTAAKWLYVREDLPRARAFATKLEKLIDDPKLVNKTALSESVLGNEVLGLIAEVNANWKDAVRFRRKTLTLLEKLRSGDDDDFADILAPPAFVSSCWVDLAIAYRHMGNVSKARLALRHARRWSRVAGVPFDGSALAGARALITQTDAVPRVRKT